MFTFLSFDQSIERKMPLMVSVFNESKDSTLKNVLIKNLQNSRSCRFVFQTGLNSIYYLKLIFMAHTHFNGSIQNNPILFEAH